MLMLNRLHEMTCQKVAIRNFNINIHTSLLESYFWNVYPMLKCGLIIVNVIVNAMIN